MLTGSVVIYLVGLPWLAVVLGTSLERTLELSEVVFCLAPLTTTTRRMIGAEQLAPLGRAVIGGLIVSTFATLTILPSIYAILQTRASVASASLNPLDPGSRYYETH